MSSSFQFRLLLLVAAIAAMLAIVGLLAHVTWTQSLAVRHHFRVVQSESAQIVGQLQGSVQSLDADLLRYKLSGNIRLWHEYEKDAASLQRWLAAQRPQLQTGREGELLAQIESEAQSYFAAAERFAGGGITSNSHGPTVEHLAELNRHSDALLGLGFDLAEAHNATLDAVLQRADLAIRRIEELTFLALGLAVVAGMGTGWLVYRDSIAPLQVKLQESRRQLERQEKLASLGVLSAGIAHEIRNPLTAVKARLFTLRKAVLQDPSAEEDVSVINGEVDRLERIVRTFLRFARPPEPELRTIEPLALLRNVETLLAPQWHDDGIRIEVDETPAPAIRADPDQLEQALLNLVQNAGEAMRGGGTIRLRAQARTTRAGSFVDLEVVDDGPGMPPEVQARLFDPFFSTKNNGTGLGLALTARIMEKHGGKVSFQTAPGKGTTFILTVPASPA